MIEMEEVKPEPDSFGKVSDDMEWGWGEEIDVCRDFISSKGLDAEFVVFARAVANEERAERAEGCDHDDSIEDGKEPDGSQIWECRYCGTRWNAGME